ncbi:MAG: M61 family peptidase [Cytophagales bacterium]|nr:MAG: M61 family peptidase [Cytophagales bacterium]TAF61698.1 MAG: M61 family peptidase [Cytophagales bacterium]
MLSFSYKVSVPKPNLRYVHLELHITGIESNEISLQLPAWRPGRYVLQHFAKKIQVFEARDPQGNLLHSYKTSKDKWLILNGNEKQIIVHYTFYANQYDAGGCYVTDNLLYLNPVCCFFYPEGNLNIPYHIELELESSFEVSCGLEQPQPLKLKAKDFYELADCPIVASNCLQHAVFTVQNSDCKFYIWIYGDWKPDWTRLLNDFKAFVEAQIELFGNIPCQEFHFQCLINSEPYYHAVEHHNSTVLMLGPDIRMDTNYQNLLAISSHELFHVWNIIHIRPQELWPYDFTKENYFRTGFVAEGITTYYGDLMLLRSQTIELSEFFKQQTSNLKAYFDDYGRLNMSVANSSYDLWLDGYEPGVPRRKTSIYHKGNIAAFILDVMIRQFTNNERSLDDLMRALWERFGKKQKGYSEQEYRYLAEEIAGVKLDNYFESFVYGTDRVEEVLQDSYAYLGLELIIEPSNQLSERYFGFKAELKNGIVQVVSIAPGSPAFETLAEKDEIVAINHKRIVGTSNEHLQGVVDLHLSVFRDNKLLDILLKADELSQFFNRYHLDVAEDIQEHERHNFENWAWVR